MRDRYQPRIALSLAVFSLVAASWGASSNRTASYRVEAAGSYVFDNIEVGPEPHPVTEEPIPGHARIHYDVSWANDVFPGKQRCVYRVYDPSGSVVGEAERYLTSLEPQSTGRIYTDVDVTGPAARAEIACDGFRLDDRNASVSIRNAHVNHTGQPGRDVEVAFDFSSETSAVGAQSCTIRARNEQGEITTETTATLVPGDANAGTWHKSVFAVPRAERQSWQSADIDCRPYSE